MRDGTATKNGPDTPPLPAEPETPPDPQRFLRPGERLDDLCHLGRRVIQRTDAYCFAMDAVLLAHFPRWRPRDHMLDLGTGTGAIPLLMAEEVAHIEAIELDETLADMAARSVALNGLADRITIRPGDYRGIERLCPAAGFDIVVTNPPYYPLGQGKISPRAARAAARHEVTATLADVVRAARYALRDRGRLAMIHIPERLDEIFRTLRENGLVPRRARLVQPRADRPPNLALIEAVAGSAAGHLRWLPTLNIYGADGAYTPELLAIYGDVAAAGEPKRKG